MADILQQLMDYLMNNQADPATYLFIFFLFCIAASIILPIPIEIALIWNPGVFFPVKALVMGLGKGVGAIAVFYIPTVVKKIVSRMHRLGLKMPRRSESEIPRWGWLRWIAGKSEISVRRFGVLAMYLIMSIPGMLDTVPLYVFSIINKEGTLMTLRDFAIANFLAGINRAFLIYAIIELLGWHLFG